MNRINEIITTNYIEEFGKSLCKIKIGNAIGNGFFMKSKVKIGFKKIAHFLVTNCHVISDDTINSKQYIEIEIEYNKEKREIQLDNELRFIKCFQKPIDIIIIEILESDNLENEIKYLKRDYLYGEGYEKYLSEDIYILHHPKGGEIECLRGKIISIDDNTFLYDSFISEECSGSDIILSNSFKIIGIQCKKNVDNINCGVFIGKLNIKLNDQNISIIPDKKEEQLISFNDLDSVPSIEIFQLITLRYKNSNLNLIRIFGNNFVQNNKDNCKIVVEDKEYNLCGKMNINKMKKMCNEYEIKLKIINDLTDLSYMFHQCNSLSPSSEINKINISNATNISYLFSECQYLSQLPDISKWNTGNVKDMSYIFAGDQSLLSLPDISKWNTNKVSKMNYMFYRCDSLKDIPDISKWDTKNVVSMSYMFYNCSNLSYLPDISNWNTSNVKYIEFMFANCQKLLSLPNFSSWDTRKVKSMQNLFDNLKLVKKPIEFPKVIKRKNKNTKYHKNTKNFGNYMKKNE